MGKVLSSLNTLHKRPQWHCEWSRVGIFEIDLEKGFSGVAVEFGTGCKEIEKSSVIPLAL